MPLKFESYPAGPLDANCIIAYDPESLDAVLFDPSGDFGLLLYQTIVLLTRFYLIKQYLFR